MLLLNKVTSPNLKEFIKHLKTIYVTIKFLEKVYSTDGTYQFKNNICYY